MFNKYWYNFLVELLKSLMKRWFVFFVICLLPLQVFAGMLAHQKNSGMIAPASSVGLPSQGQVNASEMFGDVVTTMNSGEQQTLPEQADDDDGNTLCADNDDFSGHGGVGDDTVSNLTLVFSPDLMTAAPALRHDEGSPPPFLPPAGRPPRV